MFRGSVFFTTSSNLFNDLARKGYLAIALADDIKELPFQAEANITLASILLPSYEAISAQLDGNNPLFDQLYRQQLSSREAEEYIILLLFGAVMKDNQIVIYINKDELYMYGMVLFDHIARAYGYVISEGSGYIQQNMIHLMIANFYEWDLILTDNFFRLYPMNIPVPENLAAKAMYDIQMTDKIPQKDWSSYIQKQIQRTHEPAFIIHRS